MKDLSVVSVLMRALKEQGIETVIAGGAVRDVVHGRDPKDVDLWVAGSRFSEEAIYSVEAALDAVLSGQAEGGIRQHPQFVVYGGYTGVVPTDATLMKRCTDVIKTELNGLGIDIVWCEKSDGTPVQTVEDVIDNFDLSINQYALGLDGACFTRFDGVVRPVRDDFETSRVFYLYQKYPQYDWSPVMQHVAARLANPMEGF